MRFAILLTVSFLSAPALAAQRPHPVPAGGQWLIDRKEGSGRIDLNVRYGEGAHFSNWGRRISLGELQGLSPADMDGPGKAVQFRIVRPAGTLICEGWFRDGEGSGHFNYEPNSGFVAALRQRGIGAPTEWEQFEMTMAGVGLDLVDELKHQGYQTPSAADLARMGTHGVDLEYVQEMGRLSYHLGDSESLVRMRDHGVARSSSNR
jgi:hypothetical protein